MIIHQQGNQNGCNFHSSFYLAVPNLNDMNASEIIKGNFEEAAEVLKQFMALEGNIRKIEEAAAIIAQAIKSGGKVIACGNGGSMCDAMHFAEELSGRFRDNRRALPAIAVSDPSHITCVGNDYGFDHIFSRYVDGLGKPGDVLLAISTSGNSSNVVNAIASARAADMKVIGLTGKDGGKMAGICDVEIRAPHTPYADRAQEIHIKVIHSLIQLVERSVG
ncbi:MAG: D-sedoheptulose 7-phosphate isomerase [Bacteroidota bacterium]